MMILRRRFSGLAVTLGFSAAVAAPAPAQPPTILTLEDYAKRAVDEGIKGKQMELALESAGYSRDAVMRATSLPSLTAAHNHTRSGSTTDHFNSVSDSKETTLTLNEQTPLGTTLKAVGTYGGSTDGTYSNRPGATAELTQPLYLFVWNPVARQRKRAELSFADAKSAYEQTKLSLEAQARSLYYGVMLGDESIKVEERKVTSTKKLVDVTQALVDAGRSAPVEVMRAKIRLQTDEHQLENAVTGRQKAVLNAKLFALLPLNEDVRFTSTLTFTPLQAPVNRLVNYALLHRPQLQILRHAQDTAVLDYQTAIEPTRPTFNLDTGYSHSENTFVSSNGWRWTAGASWMFFDSFVTSAQARAAYNSKVVADLNVADFERSTRVEIQSDYWDLKNLERQIRDFELSREQAKRNVEVVRLRFQNGLDRLIDVFDAEDEMRNLDNTYLTQVVQYNQTKDALSSAVGVDVDTIP